MTKLTQNIFKNAPNWVKSAAVDENGMAYWYSCSASDLFIVDDWWDWPSGFESEFIGDFHVTDWQDSATERKGYRCSNCDYHHVPHQCRECECINCYSLIV